MSSSRYFIDFHPDAEEDYSDAYHWYELQEAGLGDGFMSSMRSKLEQIAEHPETYGSKAKKGFREAIIKDFPYSVVYKVYSKEKSIFINSIHHQKLHPKKKFRK